MMTEAAIRKQVCDEIERGLFALLEDIERAAPEQSGALLGVSIGMMKVIGDARTTEGHDHD